MSYRSRRRIRITSKSPVFDVFPLLAIPLIYYNFVVFATSAAVGGQPDDWLVSPIFTITLFSGAIWYLTHADVLLSAAMVLLFVEVVKSTRTDTLSLVNHAVATLTLVVYLVEFISLPYFTTSAFFMLTLMQLVDLIAGFTITAVAARRDYG
jgi:hypothetical protein